MKIALACDLLDGRNCGMRIALDEFLNVVHQLDRTGVFELVHAKPFVDQKYEAFSDMVVKRGWRPGSGLYWSQIAVPRRLQKMQVDLLWWPHQALPPMSGPVPHVISVWDLALMNFKEPSCSRLSVAARYQWILARGLRNAAHIICHSRAVADEVMQRFELPATRISVVYPGLSELFRREIEHPVPLDPGGYILYVGTCAMRKNLVLLIEAYRLLMDQGVRNRLALLIGAPEAQKSELLRYARQIGIPADHMIILETVSPAALVDLYRKAAVFGFPSLYEGFGLPLIEASAIGLPVVALNRSAMPEVIGETGVLVDEPTPESFANGLTTALEMISSEPQETARRARSQAGQFSWLNSVKQTMGLLENAAVLRPKGFIKKLCKLC